MSVATLVPLVALGWLGWRWVQQEDATATRRHLEASASLTVAAIARDIGISEERLRSGAADWPDGAVTLTITGDTVVVTPRNRVAFLLIVEPLPEAPPFEFDPVASYLRQARAAQPAPAPVAGLAHCSSRLATDVGVGGTPIALAARYARCRLLEEAGRVADLHAEAAMLLSDLRASRWALTAATYWLYARDGRRWSGQAEETWTPAELLAEAVREIYSRRAAWDATVDSAPSRTPLVVADAAFVALVQAVGRDRRVLVASQAFVAREWLGSARAVASATETDFHIAFNPADEAALAAAADLQPALHKATQSGLPWDLRVFPIHPRNSAPTARSSRYVMFGGFAMLTTMTMLAAYVIVRAVGREMAAARQQSEFLAAVSHEFRTPLTTLRQFVERMREQPQMSQADRRVCLDAQSRATDRLTRLVESLLDVGRMEAGAQPYTFAAVDVGGLVRRLVTDFDSDARAAGHEVHWAAPDDLVVRGDERALGRALWNLLDNAVKYSPGQPVVEVIVRQDADRAAISVHDSGVGIPATERDQVFRKFQRGATARARGIAGTGLGLAMVSHIVAAHGGRVELQSDEGRGTTFTIVLPIEAGRSCGQGTA